MLYLENVVEHGWNSLTIKKRYVDWTVFFIWLLRSDMLTEPCFSFPIFFKPYDKLHHFFVDHLASVAAWLRGKVVGYWLKFLGFILDFLVGFFSSREFSSVCAASTFMFCSSFVHLLCCVVFGGGPCILLTMVQGRSFNCALTPICSPRDIYVKTVNPFFEVHK